MEIAFGAFIDGFGPTIDNFREVENRDFSKYIVSGRPAGSVVIAGEIYGQEVGGLLVVSAVDDRLFNLVFGSSQEEFDRIFPNVEHMISSIQIPAGLSGENGDPEGSNNDNEDDGDSNNRDDETNIFN